MIDGLRRKLLFALYLKNSMFLPAWPSVNSVKPPTLSCNITSKVQLTSQIVFGEREGYYIRGYSQAYQHVFAIAYAQVSRRLSYTMAYHIFTYYPTLQGLCNICYISRCPLCSALLLRGLNIGDHC